GVWCFSLTSELHFSACTKRAAALIFMVSSLVVNFQCNFRVRDAENKSNIVEPFVPYVELSITFLSLLWSTEFARYCPHRNITGLMDLVHGFINAKVKQSAVEA